MCYFSIIKMNAQLGAKKKGKALENMLPFLSQFTNITNNQIGRVINKKQVRPQFQEANVRGLVSMARLRRRVEFPIKNTPKIVIVDQTAQQISFRVQCPKLPLIDYLKTQSRTLQYETILSAVRALFAVADAYGYFYCDKLMLKCSKDCSPVVWMNQNFKLSQREFPIAESSVSELIFVKKIRATILDIVKFSKNDDPQTKEQLISYLQTEINKLSASSLNTFPLFSNKNTQLSPKNPKFSPFPKQTLVADTISGKSIKSKSPFCIKLSLSPNSCRNLTAGKYKTQYFGQPKKDIQTLSKKYGIMSVKSKINDESIKMNRERTKTTVFDRKIFENNKMKNNDEDNPNKMKYKSEHSNSFQVVVNTNKLITKVNKQKVLMKKNEKLKIDSNSSSIPFNEQKNEDTINQQFNFEQQFIEKPKNKLMDRKNRKQSAEPTPFQTWLKTSNKDQQKAFQNSTFSTRVTFSSIKGQLQSVSDYGESRDKKAESPKPDCHTIPHLYSTDRQRQTKQKFNQHIRKIMKESGLKIKQEDSFENEVQNLFESIHPNRMSIQRLRESELLQEFNHLFVESEREQEDGKNYGDEFGDVLG